MSAKTEAGAVIVERTTSLNVGDKLTVTDGGMTYLMTVSHVFTDRSIGYANAHTVVAHIRPGGWAVTLRNDNLRRYDVRWAPTADVAVSA